MIIPRELFGLKRRSVVRKISRILRLVLSPASHDDVLQGQPRPRNIRKQLLRVYEVALSHQKSSRGIIVAREFTGAFLDVTTDIEGRAAGSAGKKPQ